MKEIHILHTNDLHSHLLRWPKIRRFLIQQRQEWAKQNVETILVDLGDFIDRFHPLSEATDGVANVELMNQVSYDAVTIGNNEGIGNNKKQLNALYKRANFDIILDNLKDQTSHKPPIWAKQSKIIETKAGIRIGIIALTAPFPLTYSPNGWDIFTPNEIIPELISGMKKQCDTLLLLSHLGIQEDRRIAERYPEIEVIIGSHTHHLLPQGEYNNQSLLAAAGKFGEYIGDIKLTIHEGQIIKKQATVIPTAELPETTEDLLEALTYEEKGHQLLKESNLAYLPFTLSLDLAAPHTVIGETMKALKEHENTEAALLNSGLFLEELPTGLVNHDQLHRTLPHPIRLLNVTLSGRDLIRLVGEIEKNRAFLRNFSVKGMGFRGKKFGEIQYDGITIQQDRKIYWQDKQVISHQTYTFTTVDHLMFVPFFPTIELDGQNEFVFPDFIRNVLADYLKNHYPILEKHSKKI